MILPAQEIRWLCHAANLVEGKLMTGCGRQGDLPMITPFAERTSHGGMTYGLGPAGYDIRLAEDLTITKPARGVLGSSVERFAMPDDVLGVVHDKSTWARVGLTVQNTIIEPGWRGYLTLELIWFPLQGGEYSPLRLKAGDPIAQMVFHRLEAATEQAYAGKYQDQEPGAQAARFNR